jgi:hypothetical protein
MISDGTVETYIKPLPHELAKLTPEQFAVEWAIAKDSGVELAPRTSLDYPALFAAFPERLWEYRPVARMVGYLRLPPDWCVPAEPLPEREQERLVLALATDDRFRRAVAAVLAAEGGVI